MSIEKRNFDKDAANWDTPGRVKLASDVANAISGQINLRPDMDVLDFGCGTGLLTLRIAPFVKSITGVDSSEAMLDVLNEKVINQNITNVRILKLDPDGEKDAITGNYDLIVSNMTLHHIERIEPLLNQLYHALKPSSHLCISDLDPDKGRFHDDNTGVFHFGFDRKTLRQLFMQIGFISVKDITAAEIIKPTSDGEKRRFTVFLMVGQKINTI